MFIVGFLADAAVMVAIIATPFFIYNQLGGGAAMSGTIGAVHMAFYATACVVAARFVSRAKNGLNWASSGMVIFMTAYAIVPFLRSPVALGLVSGVAFGSMALVWPALHSWVGGEADPARRKRLMMWFNLSWSSGFAFSPFVAGPLYDIDYRLPFVLLAGLCAATLVLLRTLPHEASHFAPLTDEARQARAGHDRASEAYLYAAWCATFVINALVAVTRHVYPKRVDALVEANELRWLFESAPSDLLTAAAATKYSWLAGGLSLATAVSFLALGSARRWQNGFKLLVVAQLMSAAAFWELGHTRSLLVMMVCFVVLGANTGIAFFSSVYHSLANPALKHQRATINEAAVGLGAFTGSILLGQLVGAYGIAGPFHLTPVCIGAALLLQFWLAYRGHTRARQPAVGEAR